MHERIAKIMEDSGTEYKLRLHSELGSINGPRDVATALGYELGRITKTLLLRAIGENRYFLVVAPTNAKVDLKKLAAMVQADRLQMATSDELENHLGYPPHGVSPLGCTNIPVFMESSLLVHETILIGAGVIGQEIEVQPQAIKEITGANILEIVIQQTPEVA